MRSGHSLIVFILDRSASMTSKGDEPVSGFNQFVQDQLAVPGTADLALVLFNTLIDRVPIKPLADVPALTMERYRPNGMTALYDAVGIQVDEIGRMLAGMDEAQRPEKVIFAILTDGEENSSEFYVGEEGRQRVAEKIRHQQEKYSWEFLFLGANMDAPAVAMSLNIPASNAFTFDDNARGLSAAYATTTSNVARMRTGTGNIHSHS